MRAVLETVRVKRLAYALLYAVFYFTNLKTMNKYKYIGEDKFFVKNGQIVEGCITTWSIKKPNSNERDTVELLYIEFAGFSGEDMPINKKDLSEVSTSNGI